MEFFAPVEVERTPRAGGGFVLRSTRELPLGPRCVGDVLAARAHTHPERVFLAERDADGRWKNLTYGEAFEAARALGQVLLDCGLSRERPLMLLSGNSIDHALWTLAAMHVGVPAAPISTAFSTLARDFERLRELEAQVRPGAIFAADASCAEAVGALAHVGALFTSRDAHAFGARPAITTAVARATQPTRTVDESFAALGPDTVAKILFTSGSTGAPKGVINTQRMLCSNQQAIALNWPFLRARPPRVVDWLPWSHTFGGNHNFFMVLWHGGTMWIDSGKPAPGAFERTLENLREISPTLSFNVPRGFDLLVHELERDAQLARTYFRDLDLIFYAASALPQTTWERLERIGRATRGSNVRMVSAWGSTETAPMITQVHFDIHRAGVIGVPIPGCELAFVPSQERLEMRVRGPNVSPGYWRAGGGCDPLPRDELGFFAMGDAGRLCDETAPEQGVLFDGRTAENFKLSSGTWVRVGELRIALIAACAPLVADVVLAGHDRDEVGALLFLAPHAVASEVLESLRERIRHHNTHAGGTSARITRFAVLAEAPNLAAGEITDKGYINQRAVLERRSGLVEALFREAHHQVGD